MSTPRSYTFLNLLRLKKTPLVLPPANIMHFNDGALVELKRGRKTESTLRLGPNEVYAFITHEDGSVDEIGTSFNLITNGGIDYVAYALGGKLGYGTGTASGLATGSSGTTLTDSGASWTVNQFIGQYVIAEESTNAPVHGTVLSNTSTALTIDAWRDGDDSSGTTPGSTANYSILAGQAPVRYMALTTDSGAASAADTALASEITTNGGGRAIATFAHSASTTTFTLTKAYTITGTLTAIHKMGLFFVSTASSGPIIFETVLNADATVVNGDTLTITETVTLS